MEKLSGKKTIGAAVVAILMAWAAALGFMGEAAQAQMTYPMAVGATLGAGIAIFMRLGIKKEALKVLTTVLEEMQKAQKVALISLVFLAGCCLPQEVENEVRLNDSRMQKFVQLMDAGETARDQEQRMLRANKKAWAVLNTYINK